MDKSKNSYLTPISLGVATVWFSTHCGAGFASGTQELQYFANHGWFGVLFPLLTFLVIALTYYVGMETARQTGKFSYNEWTKEAFGKYSKIFSPGMEISVIIVTIAASAATLATGGLLVNQYLGLPVLLGSFIMLVIITLICIFGESVVRKNAMIMSAAIIGIISIVIVAGLIKFWPDIVRLFSERYVNPQAAKWSIENTTETVQGSVGNALLWALTYAGFQIGAVGGIVASFKGGLYKKEAQGAIIIGYFMNVIMLIGIALLIFSQMPGIYLDEATRALPTIAVVNQLDIPALEVLYPILLFLALITTAVGLIFGMIARVEPYVLKNMDNVLLKKTIISVGCLVVCYLISTLGLMWVVQTAYKYLGIWSWIFNILPLWFIGYKRLRDRDKLGAVK
ncbi:hypothetical protein LQU94_07390 [Peptoniphilus sp. KCTC 25270]|uniref:YkvI family membrane protein n=1 Tax=Peptoniphilus sp. KCTC 25270 TaxID=2897414 RepID=UPI001E5A1512|nr:hypothetical protein [Peptoniphilus sp. KCTC 25270]MCD1147934.1 hypothetical protein [Peptoniphilus sp. KCTC 25270]